MNKIGIIGGGISGLTAAFLLNRRGFEISLFEKSDRVGGNIQSKTIDGFLIEYAPNSLLKSPRLIDLIRELDLEAEVLPANATNKKRYVLRDGKLKSLPMSVAGLMTGDYFSWKAKLRLLKEPFVKSKSPDGESVAKFFERRLGLEIVEHAADPFIAGIYAGNPENLSIRSAFPRLHKLEKSFGSLLIGALLSKSEKTDRNFPRTFSFKNGVQTLTEKLAESLGESIKTETKILDISKTADKKWQVKTNFGEEKFDALIISTPAESGAKLIENLDENLSRRLREIYYPPVAMIFFGVKKESVGRDLDGFGFLIPSSEKRKILGTVFNSAVFENRAPEGFHLLTTFVGGARQPEICGRSDAELYETVFAELETILDLREPPVFRHLTRWRRAIPQYNIGYDKIETAIENFENVNRGIFICSNFYEGISVGDCVKNAYALAEKISHEQTRKGTKDL